MIKKLEKFFQKDKNIFEIPKSVQDVIPIKTIYRDGIFLVDKNKYSKTFKFTDINFAAASKDDKESMFIKYSELINSLDPSVDSKITILNRRLNKIDYDNNIKIKEANDGLDELRKEYNDILLTKALDNKSIIQEKFLTITINKKNIDEARTYFSRIGAELKNHFNIIGAKCIELDAIERLRIAHNFYRSDEENNFNFDMLDNMRKGHSFKDYICPDNFTFQKDYFEMGNKFGRVLFLKDYSNFIRDDFVSELTELNKNLILSVDVEPVPMDVAVKMVENIRLGNETNIANWQRKQNNNNNFSAVVPYDLEMQRKEINELLEDLIVRDQRLFFSLLTIMLIADTKEELEEYTDSLLAIGRKNSCQISILKYQQMEGLNTVLPFRDKRIQISRTLITESLAIFIPFKVQEINHKNGVYYGENAISNNMILADRKELLNGNSFILGISGSGKSFAAKNEIVSIALRDKNADIIIIDPEREYRDLIKNLHGEVIEMSAISDNHINAMDINSGYGDGNNPLILKSEFLLSLCEELMDGKKLGAKEKSIIDRCTSKVYRAYQQGNYQGLVPTLQDFREELLRQPEEEAQAIALSIELYSKGNLNTFSKQTNVNPNNRIVCYDVLDLKGELCSIGMLVILDNILNRITSNRFKGRNTYIFIDEIYLLFKHEYSANFLFTLWKRVRKYGAFCTGITQNVEDLLQSHIARTMLSNSEFIIMLSESASDSLELSRLLNISQEQMRFINNVVAGSGLLKIGSALVPFKNSFPDNTKLYSLMTTKLKEIKRGEVNE